NADQADANARAAFGMGNGSRNRDGCAAHASRSLSGLDAGSGCEHRALALVISALVFNYRGALLVLVGKQQTCSSLAQQVADPAGWRCPPPRHTLPSS